jgi:DNA-binding IclR family transcriptional regulator
MRRRKILRISLQYLTRIVEVDSSVIKTAGRVFEVLEYMREQRRAVTAREVSERLGYPRSSSLVLLKSMAALGYLRYDLQHRAFYATARLATLGDWVLDSMFQGGMLLELLDNVARITGQTAILAVENDIYAQYVQIVLGRGPMQFNVQPGTRRLLAMSGLGWVLLSMRSHAEIERIVQRTNSRLNPGGQRVDPAYVVERVRETREQGFAFSKGAVAEGVGVIGIALPPGDTAERIAIGIGGLVSQLERSRDAFVQVMKESIAEYIPRPDTSSTSSA